MSTSLTHRNGHAPAELKPEQVVIAIDTREQLPVAVAPMPSKIVTLATGDYGLLALPTVAAIERKSESDLLGCIGVERERFERELMRLLAYPCRALVIESTWERIEAGQWRSKITPAAAMGSLIGWAALGIPIFMVDTHERAGKFIGRILYIAARREYRRLRALLAEPEASPVKLSPNAYSPGTINSFSVDGSEALQEISNV